MVNLHIASLLDAGAKDIQVIGYGQFVGLV